MLLMAGGLFSAFRANQPISSQRIADHVQENLVRVIDGLNREARKQIERIRQGQPLAVSETQFLVVDSEKILEWSNGHFIPSYYIISSVRDIKYVRLSSGDFIIRRMPVDSTRSLVTIIPLHIQYRISNDYVKPYWHPQIFDDRNVAILLPELEEGHPIKVNDKIIFRVKAVRQLNPHTHTQGYTLAFFGLALLVMVILVGGWVKTVARTKPVMAFVLLAGSLVALRTVMIGLQFPAQFDTLWLFDAKDFASSQWNPSLGDMLLNGIVIFVLCVYVFKHYTRFCFLSRANARVIMLLSVIAIFYGMLYPAVVTQTIYNNSEITLGISQSLDFNVLRIAAFVLLTISCISAFLFIHVALKLLTRNENVGQISISILAGCLIFIVLSELSRQPYVVPAIVTVFYLVSVVSFKVYNTLGRFQYATFVYIFLAVICFAFTGAHVIGYLENQQKAKNQQRFAENFLIERDYFGEYLMGEAADKIGRDVFIQSRLNNPLLDKNVVRHKIEQVSLSGYFNRYTVSIRLFDPLGVPLPDEPDTVRFATIFERYNQEQFKTEYRNVFYLSNSQDRTLKKYAILVPVQKRSATIGYVTVELTLKRILPENVYPELLVDNRFQQAYRPRGLSYAIIDSSQIEYSAGNFNYEALIGQELDNPELYAQGILRNGYLHVGVEDVNGRVAIVSSQAVPVVYALADFSFLVLLGISAVLVFLLAEGIAHYTGTKNLFYSARIQLILNLAFFVPLVAVCIITLGLTAKTSREQLKSDFLNKAIQFGKTASLIVNNAVDPDDFENEFKNVAMLSGLDANLYGNNGALQITSQPLIFENQMHSPYLDPAVLRRMAGGEVSFVSTDQVGSLEFYVAYSKVLSSETGAVLGILAIPFFQSGESLRQMQISVLANIISIFILVFIVLMIISFFVTKWLTAPLNMITKTFGRISLTTVNKPLEWKSDDEIGLMVREYNHMLDTLSNSKRELERNQREKAWREIAQQVAHEIKNPLTPMKLSLQQLERSLKQNDQRDEKLAKTVLSLLAQINSLDELASSFSSFARMPEPVMKPVELVSLLNRVVNLHTHEGAINFKTDLSNAPIFADDQLLARIFSNIILNGIQAVPKDVQPEIVVTLEVNELHFTVLITDNGSGVDPELMDKIFLPHFTTKKTGSGLGLAIARQGIEQMGGKISFKTSAEGTTFRIELPRNT